MKSQHDEIVKTRNRRELAEVVEVYRTRIIPEPAEAVKNKSVSVWEDVAEWLPRTSWNR